MANAVFRAESGKGERLGLFLSRKDAQAACGDDTGASVDRLVLDDVDPAKRLTWPQVHNS